MILEEQTRVGKSAKKKKRKRLIDQIYNGVFENAELTKDTRNVLINSGVIIILGIAASYAIQKK